MKANDWLFRRKVRKDFRLWQRAEGYVPKTQNVIMYHAKDYAFDGKTSKNRTVLCSISRSDGTVTSLKSSKPGVLKVMSRKGAAH